MVRFIHSGDWQLGMTRHFLDEKAQAQFTESRFDVIRTIGRLARTEEAEFVVVCGDVFESNQVDRRTVRRALDALRDVPVPVFLLPGNHDPLDAGSVYRSAAFTAGKPAHVHVLDGAGSVEVQAGVEVVGAPWRTKRPLSDLVASACRELSPSDAVLRVAVGHGAIDALSPAKDDPSLVSLQDAERALAEGRIHYLALGDRHSVTSVGTSGRVWYAGAPEPTDYDEERPGFVLLVDLEPGTITVEEKPIATWRFLKREWHFSGAEDVEALRAWLESVPDRARTVLKLTLIGTLPLRGMTRLDGVLEEARDVFGAVEVWARHTDLVVLPDDADLSHVRLSGFAKNTFDQLRAAAASPSPEGATARDALALLYRLSRGGRS